MQEEEEEEEEEREKERERYAKKAPKSLVSNDRNKIGTYA